MGKPFLLQLSQAFGFEEPPESFYMVRMVSMIILCMNRGTLLTTFFQDSAEHEFPFLQEVFTPRDPHKIEYDRFLLQRLVRMHLQLTKHV